MTRIPVTELALLCLTMITGCSGGVGISGGGVTHAAGFSNASLTGTYAFTGQSTSYVSQGSLKYALVGFVTLDGSGNVTAGSTTEANEQFSSVCADSLAGTYAVNADGTGTATITANNTAVGCGNETDSFALVISSGGNLVNVVLTTPARKAISYGVLYKQ